jgi:hypothetical protein
LASSFRSPMPVRTWRRRDARHLRMGVDGGSMGRRCGRPEPGLPPTAWPCAAPIRKDRSIRA